MNKNVIVKILAILIILAISLISFVGIYVKRGNDRVNLIPDYQLSKDLKGTRTAKLVIDSSTKELVFDSNGNVSEDGVDSEGNLKEGYSKKDEPINPKELLNQENYKLCKEIIEKRLSSYGVNDYTVRLNNENGEIIVELYETKNTDTVIYNLEYLGEFTVNDSETKEILLSNKDVKYAKAVYGTNEIGTTVYLSIEFNKEGKKKLQEISKNYIETKDEEGKSTTKKVTINIDGEQLTETYFAEENREGLLQLSVGSATTDVDTIQSYLEQASSIASLIDSGKMPIKYDVSTNNNLSAGINQDILKICISSIGLIILVALVYVCIKYKVNGIFLSISYIGYIALLLIVLRYTNVMLSIDAMVGFIVLLGLNYIFTKYVLKGLSKGINKKELVKQTYLRYISILIPVLLISIVFTFMKWIQIASLGMVLFWGLIVMFIYNYITINVLLNDK
ncbi:MAG: hypothetical protein HFJ58_06240 [Clostridia bacterium]|nr:hypothetical protein [Clostridia bacterium]